MGENNRQKTEGGDKHRRRAVRLHAVYRVTTNAIFAACQVIEKHREMQKDMHIVFIDLGKAGSVEVF